MHRSRVVVIQMKQKLLLISRRQFADYLLCDSLQVGIDDLLILEVQIRVSHLASYIFVVRFFKIFVVREPPFEFSLIQLWILLPE